jgi:hypothetical protein
MKTSVDAATERAVRELAAQVRKQVLFLSSRHMQGVLEIFIDELSNTGDAALAEDERSVAFARAGRGLFGDRFKADIAGLLGIAPDTADEWSKGRRPVPRGVWPELHHEITRRIADLLDVQRSIAAFIEPP